MATYEIPERNVPADDAAYFEKISQAVFQSGFSWAVIRQKWPGFQQAFAQFDIDTVAGFNELDVERLVEDKRIVRNGRKIQATIHNARICQQLIQQHGALQAYVQSLASLPYNQQERALCKQFKFVGPMGAYFFFWSVGAEVPDYETWRASQKTEPSRGKR